MPLSRHGQEQVFAMDKDDLLEQMVEQISRGGAASRRNLTRGGPSADASDVEMEKCQENLKKGVKPPKPRKKSPPLAGARLPPSGGRPSATEGGARPGDVASGTPSRRNPPKAERVAREPTYAGLTKKQIYDGLDELLDNGGEQEREEVSQKVHDKTPEDMRRTLTLAQAFRRMKPRIIKEYPSFSEVKLLRYCKDDGIVGKVGIEGRTSFSPYECDRFVPPPPKKRGRKPKESTAREPA